MIVADASIIVRGLVQDGDSRKHIKGNDLHVVHLTDYEVVAALTRLTRRKDLDAQGAQKALARWVTFGVRRHPVLNLVPRIWELRENVKAYDAAYVALAEQLQLPLVTVDKRLGKVGRVRCEIVVLDS